MTKRWSTPQERSDRFIGKMMQQADREDTTSVETRLDNIYNFCVRTVNSIECYHLVNGRKVMDRESTTASRISEFNRLKGRYILPSNSKLEFDHSTGLAELTYQGAIYTGRIKDLRKAI